MSLWWNRIRRRYWFISPTSQVVYISLFCWNLKRWRSFPYVVKNMNVSLKCVHIFCMNIFHVLYFFKLQAVKYMFAFTTEFRWIKKEKLIFKLDFFFFQTTHHVHEALWKCGDTNYTDIQDRPVPPAPRSNGQTNVQWSSKCYSR